MITEEQAVSIASDVVRRERGWEPRLCRVVKIAPSRRPPPSNVGSTKWAVVFWYPDVTETQMMDPSTYAVDVDAESGEATLAEE
jgi:hypothetical protein